MRLYRIAPERYLEDLSGRGSSYRHGGRWNPPGLPALYFACSPATALLELANYLPSPRLVPSNYFLGVYDAPDDSTRVLEREDWPAEWRDYPYPASTQAIGSQWLQEGKNLLLIVPSVTVPAGLESNALVNPLHPATASIRLLEAHPARYDERSFGE